MSRLACKKLLSVLILDSHSVIVCSIARVLSVWGEANHVKFTAGCFRGKLELLGRGGGGLPPLHRVLLCTSDLILKPGLRKMVFHSIKDMWLCDMKLPDMLQVLSRSSGPGIEL